jgi:hypothetical protein
MWIGAILRRRQRYGPNRVRAAPRESGWRVLARQFANVVVARLVAATALSVAFRDIGNGVTENRMTARRIALRVDDIELAATRRRGHGARPGRRLRQRVTKGAGSRRKGLLRRTQRPLQERPLTKELHRHLHSRTFGHGKSA